MIPLAARMSRIGTETAFEVLARAKDLEARGKDIIHLEIGEPDFDTPFNIREAAKKALDDGWTHYGPSPGLPQLRDVIAEEIRLTRGIEVDRENIVVTPGGKPIMFFTILAMAESGLEIIYPNPGFPIYESLINFMGATAVPVPLREERDFRFDVEELLNLVSDKTCLIILNSPQNPTGGVLMREDLEAIAEVCLKRNIYVLSDEIYSRMIYEGNFESITQFSGMPENTFILDGFSKTYAMTGWRLGYGVFPKPMVEVVANLMTNSNSCTASFIQMAGIEAITGPQDESKAMMQAFRQRRDVMVAGLNRIPGLSCRNPKGAFYVFPNISETGKSSEFLENYLLQEMGVACLAGTSFGQYGQGFLRLSYANSIPNLERALDRIETGLKKL